LQVRLEPYRVKLLSGASLQGRLLTLPANIDYPRIACQRQTL
jgi:hypothetical protein